MFWRRRLPAILCGILSLLLIIAAVLGPLVLDRIRFHMSDAADVQYVGGEFVTLLVAGLLLMMIPFWRHGDLIAPMTCAGAGLYTVYTFITVVMGQEYASYSGNAENAFLLYAAISGMSAMLVLLSMEAMAARIDAGARLSVTRLTSWVLIVLAVFIALTWLAQIRQVYWGTPSSEYDDSRALFWLIKYLDLGFLVPMMIMVGIRLRGSLTRATILLAITFVGFGVCLMAAMTGMSINMFLTDDPNASMVFLVVTIIGTLFLGSVFLRWCRAVTRTALPDRTI